VVGPDKFVVNYWTKDLESCPRATHVLEFYPHEVAEKKRAGLWLTWSLAAARAANDDQAPHTFLEQHRLWDLDGDDYPEPYIVTVHKETRRWSAWSPASMSAGSWKQDGKVVQIKPVRCFTKYPFIPSPDGSFYDIGFGTLLGALGETINTTINQLMDAGHLANVQGGFIGSRRVDQVRRLQVPARRVEAGRAPAGRSRTPLSRCRSRSRPGSSSACSGC
jgi:chaperonin GroES